MPLLIASLLALAVGPALASRLRPDGGGMAALDGFVLVAVSGLVFLHLLPDAVLTGGWWAVGAASVGLFLPGLAERALLHAPGDASVGTSASPPEHAHGAQGRVLLVLALAGLALHAALDGAALLAHDLQDAAALADHAGHAAARAGAEVPTLALGVILHRLPLGLAVWWAVGQGPHRRRAVALLSLVGVATVLGFVAGQQGLAHLPLRGLAVFQALVAGALIHVVFQHPPIAAARGPVPTLAAAAGGLVGAAALVGLAWLHAGGEGHGGHGGAHGGGADVHLFAALLFQGAPALLAGLGLSALLRGALPPRSARTARRHGSARGLAAGLGAAAAGLALPAQVPACPCHTRAHFRDLLARGDAPAKALGYLLSSPALGLVPWALAWALLGPRLALAWALTSVVVVLLGAAIGGLAARAPGRGGLAAALHEHPLPRGPIRRALASVRPLVGHSLAWALAGAALGAYVAPVVAGASSGSPAGAASWGYVLAAAVLALPLYMGGAGAVAVVAALLVAGVGVGPALAALVVATALHPASLPLVASTLGARAAAAVGVAVVALAVGAGLLAQALAPPVALGWASGGGPALHAAPGGAAPGTISWLAVGLLGALMLLSLSRMGPRGLLAEMFPLSGSQGQEPPASSPATETSAVPQA